MFYAQCPWCLCLDSHISDTISTPRKGRWATEKNCLLLPSDSPSKWPNYSPTLSDSASTPEPEIHSMGKEAAEGWKLLKDQALSICVSPIPRHASLRGTQMNLHLKSSLENTCLHPFPLLYTWQTFGKPTWTGLEFNWIGNKLPTEKLPPLFPQGKLLFVPSSMLSRHLLGASV